LIKIDNFLRWEPHNLFFTPFYFDWTTKDNGQVTMIKRGCDNTKLEEFLKNCQDFGMDYLEQSII